MKKVIKFFINNNIVVISILSALLIMLAGNPSFAQNVASGPDAYSSAAIDLGGNLYVWGWDNYNHTFDYPKTVQDSTPVMVAFPTGVTSWKAVACGPGFTLALGSDSNVYSWGYNRKGQLGNGTTDNSTTPGLVLLPNSVKATAIAAGDSCGFAIGADGQLYAWGGNDKGQLGNGSSSTSAAKSTPDTVIMPSTVTFWKKISAAAYSVLAIGDNDTLYAWGNNSKYDLGINNTTQQNSAVAVKLPAGITASTPISGQWFNGCITTDGNLYEWGNDDKNEIGDSLTTSRKTPFRVYKPNGVNMWKTAAFGSKFVLAIGDNDTLYAWGQGGNGQMGNGQKNGSNPGAIIVQLPLGVTPVQVAAGSLHGLAMDKKFHVYAWGTNSEGELGIDSTTTQTLPVQVVGVGGVGSLDLPVELSSFSAAINNKIVELKWTTSSENNNSGFEVQRSTDIKTFTKIGFVKGSGSSTKINEYSFIDKNISGNIYYRLNQVDFNGTSKYSKIIEVNVQQPLTYNLDQNYPNPFNPATVIKYSVAKDGFISLKVYNLLGQEVANLYQGFQKAGSYKLNFDASKLSSGVYLYNLQTNGFNETRKMMLLK